MSAEVVSSEELARRRRELGYAVGSFALEGLAFSSDELERLDLVARGEVNADDEVAAIIEELGEGAR